MQKNTYGNSVKACQSMMGPVVRGGIRARSSMLIAIAIAAVTIAMHLIVQAKPVKVSHCEHDLMTLVYIPSFGSNCWAMAG